MDLQTKSWEIDSIKKTAIQERLKYQKSRAHLLRSFFLLIALFQKYIYENLKDQSHLNLRNHPQVQSFLREKKLHKQELFQYFDNQIINKFGVEFFGNLKWLRMMINLDINDQFRQEFLMTLSGWLLKEVEKRKPLVNN